MEWTPLPPTPTDWGAQPPSPEPVPWVRNAPGLPNPNTPPEPAPEEPHWQWEYAGSGGDARD
jgi:hypothetical protein